MSGLRQVADGWPLTADRAPLVFEVRGSLSEQVLRERLSALAERHEALRLCHGRPGAQLRPEQAVDAAFAAIPTYGADPVAVATAMATAGYRGPGGVLWAVRHLRCAAGPEHLILGVSAGMADSWSLHILAEELINLYGSGAQPPSSRPAPAVTASEWAAHHESATSGSIADEREFWSAQLAGADFGTDPRVTRSLSLPAAFDEVPLDHRELDGLAELAAAFRTTAFVVVAAAVHRVWATWIGTSDTLLLTEVGQRDDSRFDHTVTCAVEPRPVRIASDPSTGFGDLIDAARGVVLNVLENSSVPLSVDDTPMQPFLREAERMTVLVEFDTANAPRAEAEDAVLLLRDDIAVRCARPPRADLHVMLRSGERGHELYFAYNRLAVSAAAAKRFRELLADVLRSALQSAAPGERLAPWRERVGSR